MGIDWPVTQISQVLLLCFQFHEYLLLILYLVLRVSTRAAVDRSACKREIDWTPQDMSEAMPRHDEHVAQAMAGSTAATRSPKIGNTAV